MKLTVINGSPRKEWNTSRLLNKFVEGVQSVLPDVEINDVRVYDHNFTGCKSCFACKLKVFEDQDPECRVKDEVHDLIRETRESDGIVIGSPIYFMDLSAQTKAFLERAMYPGKTPKKIPSQLILTMNADEDSFKNHIENSIGITEMYLTGNFGVKPERFAAYDTWQRDREERFKKSSHDMEAKRIRHETQFPVDLENAYKAGVNFAEKMKEQANV